MSKSARASRRKSVLRRDNGDARAASARTSRSSRVKSSSRHSCCCGRSRRRSRHPRLTAAHRARALGGSIASTRAARSCGRWHSREDDWSLSACEHLRRRDGGAAPARSSTGPSSASVLIPRALPRAENVSTALVARYRRASRRNAAAASHRSFARVTARRFPRSAIHVRSTWQRLPALARKMRPPRTTVCDSRQKTRAGGPF